MRMRRREIRRGQTKMWPFTVFLGLIVGLLGLWMGVWYPELGLLYILISAAVVQAGVRQRRRKL